MKPWLLHAVVLLAMLFGQKIHAVETSGKVFILLWFDTEDYLLPDSDDAALRLANYLTSQNVTATFKIVGEKARSLEKRGRKDVIEALSKHDIGFHSNYHSVHPTPATYSSTLGWEEGAQEFIRREQQGIEDIKRIFGKSPSCYGQPGSSWTPQSYGALKSLNIPLYLDSGNHVNLNGNPCYFSGILNLYKLKHTFRPNLDSLDTLEPAKLRFLESRKEAAKNTYSLVSSYYHPCELVHKEFWDGVNFRGGNNPPWQQWKLPPVKSQTERDLAFQIFHEWIQFLKRFPESTFITATQASELFKDPTPGTAFSNADLATIQQTAAKGLRHQLIGDKPLSCAEVFSLLNQKLLRSIGNRKAQPTLPSRTILGPTGKVSPITEPLETTISQLQRTSQDVQSQIDFHSRIPTSIWLGSQQVDPASYLATIIRLLENPDLLAGDRKILFQPARMEDEDCVEMDESKLWKWVIFPPGFRAPEMMRLARQQAWSIKPATPKMTFLLPSLPDKK